MTKCRTNSRNASKSPSGLAGFLFQPRQKSLQNTRNRFFHALLICLHHNFGIDGRFIRGIDAGELSNLPCPRFLIKIFRIALLADLEWCVDEDLNKFGITFHRNRAGPLSIRPIRGDEGGDDDVAGVRHQLCDFAHAPNVFNAVFWRKSQVGIQAMPDVVTVEHVGMHCPDEKFSLKRLRDGGFARAGKPGEPDDYSAMSMLCSTRLRGDFSFAPENILALDRAAIGVNAAVTDPAAANHPVIDQNKATEWWKTIVVIQHNRRTRLNG